MAGGIPSPSASGRPPVVVATPPIGLGVGPEGPWVPRQQQPVPLVAPLPPALPSHPTPLPPSSQRMPTSYPPPLAHPALPGPSFSRRGRPPSDASAPRDSATASTSSASQSSADVAAASTESRPSTSAQSQVIILSMFIFDLSTKIYRKFLTRFSASASDCCDAARASDHVSVPLLWKAFPTTGSLAPAYSHSHGREAVPVHHLRSPFQPVAAGANPHACSFRFFIILGCSSNSSTRTRTAVYASKSGYISCYNWVITKNPNFLKGKK